MLLWCASDKNHLFNRIKPKLSYPSSSFSFTCHLFFWSFWHVMQWRSIVTKHSTIPLLHLLRAEINVICFIIQWLCSLCLLHFFCIFSLDETRIHMQFCRQERDATTRQMKQRTLFPVLLLFSFIFFIIFISSALCAIEMILFFCRFLLNFTLHFLHFFSLFVFQVLLWKHKKKERKIKFSLYSNVCFCSHLWLCFDDMRMNSSYERMYFSFGFVFFFAFFCFCSLSACNMFWELQFIRIEAFRGREKERQRIKCRENNANRNETEFKKNTKALNVKNL